MVLQALAQFYDILISDAEIGISPPGYSRTKISYALNISKEGELLEVIPLKVKVLRGKKEYDDAPAAIVPEQVKKTSGVSSNFLCENSAYTMGFDGKGAPEGAPERALKCFEAFKLLHQNILAETTCEEATALLRFLDHWDPEKALENGEVQPYKDELTAGANIVFKLDCGEYLHECAPLKKAWESYKNVDLGGKQMQCLITGEMAPIARLNPSIKGVRGAQSSGASLVSFNARAYESYGRDEQQGLNSPISEKAAFAYGTALNYLIADREHQLLLGDSTLVYWAQGKSSSYRNTALFLLSSDKIRATEKGAPANAEMIHDKTAEKFVGSIFDKIANGKKISDEISNMLTENSGFNDISELKGDTNFYVLALSPNAARISVRFFWQDSFGSFVEKIAQHYMDMRIEKQYASEPDAIPLWLLLSQTVSPNSKDKASSPLLSGSVLRAIISGTPYPASLLSAVMLRIKAERNINYCKAAIIKACLTRQNPKKYEEVLTMALNTDCEHVAYLLGQLFAVLEKAQEDASPGINTTIKDKYFSSASSTPASVFPLLLKMAQHHMEKDKFGYAKNNMISEILEKIDVITNPIPPSLTLEDQGLFIVGYYHQRNAFFVKKAEIADKNKPQNNEEA